MCYEKDKSLQLYIRLESLKDEKVGLFGQGVLLQLA